MALSSDLGAPPLQLPQSHVIEAKSPPQESIWVVQRKAYTKYTPLGRGFQDTAKEGNTSLARRGGARLGKDLERGGGMGEPLLWVGLWVFCGVES